jgi:lycopene elongase/hydratase (dihydrobisanhydrobacterioruberin-forming)
MAENFEEFFWGKKIDDENIKNPSSNLLKRKILAYLVASRIPTIPITISFFLLGEWWAIKEFLFYPTLIMMFFLILAEFVSGFTNFLFDKKLDIFARKHNVWIFKYISDKELLISSIICSVVGLYFLWHYFDFTVFIMGSILVIITFLYSMPPVRFKTKPLIDIVSNMLIFGSLPFVLGWLTSGAKTSMDIFILGLIMGIPVISYTLLISWRDIKTDAEFGIKPTNVLLGYNWTIHAAIILWILLLFLCVYKFYLDVITISFLGVFPVLMILWLRHIKLKDLRQKNINFFLPISTMLWSFLVFLLLCILTCSIIPAIFLIIAILLFFKNSFKIYHSLKHISS